MKIRLTILILAFLGACNNPEKAEKEIETSKNATISQEIKPKKNDNCDYIEHYNCLGNTGVDTIRTKYGLIDPIDDFTSFKEVDFGFVTKENKIYKKATTHRHCGEQFITVEYYQDLTNRIDLASYRDYDDRFFTTKNDVYFWWGNSGGHLIIPIDKADAKTFKPFQDICGGIDKKGVYYGCPNRGVYQLKVAANSDFEFIAKEDNYWNSPSHYLVVNNEVYDVKYEIEKGYFCELNETISIEDVLKN